MGQTFDPITGMIIEVPGGSGGTPSGPAGGDLTGTYPNPTIDALKVTAAKLATDAVETAKIKDLNVTTAKIDDLAVTAAKLGAGSVTVTKIGNSQVNNAKLGNMATQTIKGRTTAGIGDPEDLTATQATAILNNVVGDSGAGGTKGLVPAPASGDTAAKKVLQANGSFGTDVGYTPTTSTHWNNVPTDVKGGLDELARRLNVSGPSRLASVYEFEEDWMSGAIAGDYGWIATLSGGAQTMNTALLSGTEWGLAQISSGTTSGNNALLALGVAKLIFGTAEAYYETKIRLNALSVEGVTNYTARIGFYDNFSGVAGNGIYFLYDTTVSTNWIMGTANGGSRTHTATSTAVAAGAFVKLGIRISGSSAEFFVDGVSIGTQSTNFPTAAVFPGFGVIKGATGATAGILVIDWASIYAYWSGGR